MERPILFSTPMVELREIPLANCDDYRAGSDGKRKTAHGYIWRNMD